MKKINIIILILLLFVFANLIFLDLKFFGQAQKEEVSQTSKQSVSQIVSNKTTPTPVLKSETCDSNACQALIDEKIKAAIEALPEATTQIIDKTTTIEKTSEVSEPTVSYIPINGSSFSTVERDWVDVPSSSFYLDTNDYPNLDKAYFEAFIKTKHGQGRAFARLFDVTHSIGVQGSEVSADSEDYTLVESGSLSFWKGKNLYKVQVKSLNGYSAYFDFGRVKLYLE